MRCHLANPGKYHYFRCNKSKGDATNWDEQTLHLLSLAKPHLISGALVGVFLGDELSASGHGSHPTVKGAVTFHDLELWIDLVRGFLDALAPARRAAGVKDPLILCAPLCQAFACSPLLCC